MRNVPNQSESKCPDLSDEAVGAAERGLDLGADADEPAGHGVLQLILLGVQRHDAREYRLARQLAVRVLAHEPRPHLATYRRVLVRDHVWEGVV